MRDLKVREGRLGEHEETDDGGSVCGSRSRLVWLGTPSKRATEGHKAAGVSGGLGGTGNILDFIPGVVEGSGAGQ